MMRKTIAELYEYTSSSKPEVLAAQFIVINQGQDNTHKNFVMMEHAVNLKICDQTDAQTNTLIAMYFASPRRRSKCVDIDDIQHLYHLDEDYYDEKLKRTYASFAPQIICFSPNSAL